MKENKHCLTKDFLKCKKRCIESLALNYYIKKYHFSFEAEFCYLLKILNKSISDF